MTPPKGYKHTELGILPQDWEVVRLGEVCENFGGKSLEKEVVANGKYRFISIGNYSVDGRYIDNGQRISLNQNTQEKLLKKGELVMVLNDKTSDGKIIGSTILIDKNDAYIYNQRSEKLVCSKQLKSLFAWFFLNSENTRKRIFKMSQGGTQIYVNFSSVKNLQIPLPPLAEQEKIAEILSTWDTQIQNYESLIKEKQTLKKGLCQTLLTAKTRLKGFSEDWEVVRLGEVAKIVMGVSPKSEFYNQNFEGLPLIQGKNDTLEKKSFTITYTQKSIRECQKGDILMSVRAPIGFVFWASERSSIGRGVCAIHAKQNQAFLFYVLDSLESRWGKIGQGSTFTAISKNDILDFQFAIPSLAEQEKIAEILGEGDREIMLLEQKLESLKSQKKGIMQNLLNGKVRVKI